MGRFAAQLRDVPKKCVDAVGISVSITRNELAAASPQDGYGLDDGHEGYDAQNATGFTFNVVPAPVDLTELPGDLLGVELRKFRGPSEDCDFPPSRGMTLTINDGPETGTVLQIQHVPRSVAGASCDIYTGVPEGAAGVLSSGSES